MLNMVKYASVQATDIYKDPYGYTYSEMVGVLGEVEADKFYRELYSGSQSSNKYKTITIKEIFRGPDTQKYAFELSDGYCIETVSIKRKTGTTVCVSTMILNPFLIVVHNFHSCTKRIIIAVRICIKGILQITHQIIEI